MKISRRLISKFKEHRGATAVVVAITMAMLIGIAALAIDVGYVAITKNELQNVVDASALAAARQLGENYKDPLYVPVKAPIVAVAYNIAKENTVAGESISILDSDVFIGKWEGSPLTVDDLTQPNAVTVTYTTNPITSFFAKIFTDDPVNVSASATAALSGPGNALIELPFGISSEWFEDGCGDPIKFNPTDACAGWHVFDDFSSPVDSAQIADMLSEGYILETIAGETVYLFGEGNFGVGSANEEFEKLFDIRKLEKEPHDEWTTTVGVFDLTCDENLTGQVMITGFATITILGITPAPEREILARVDCNIIVPGGGGGEYYGTYVPPRLVE